jgi:hypothetical protein
MMKCISLVGTLTFALILFLTIPTINVADVEIALEAELASKIQAPMAIGVPSDAKDKGGPEPDEPSNGEFIWGPGAPVTGGGGSGFAEFIIDIPEDGVYAAWGRVVAWDGNSDSFWATWEPADPAENPEQTQNFDFRWATAQGPGWHWDRINQWLDAGTFDREWELDKGETKLTIWVREDATMLDCLFITDNLVADSGAAGVREPTDEDRKLQKEGGVKQAVDAVRKLSTAWGRIKLDYNN